MGIQNYLKRVSTATKNIKSAIEEKGVPVSQCDGLEVLADKVRQIQTGGSQMFTMLAFKQSETAPAVPTGGYFSDENITYPTGWSDGAGLTENIWMSYAIINSDGSFYKDWVSPIKISNETKEIDLTDYALKSWVSAEIAKISTGGSIDLSNYYTKSEIDSKIPNSVVSSINGLNGDVVLQGSSTVTITSSDNTLIFTANGGGSEPSESYVSCRLYTTSNSKEVAPEIPGSNVSWDLETKTLINLPTGWRKKVIATAAAPYVWEIVGNFSTSTGLQIGDWDGPNCLSGNDGEQGKTGPKGEDGDSWEEVYAAIESADTPTIDSTTTDSNGKTKKDDGYLPTFIFGSTRVEASSDRPSASDTNRYVWGTKRRGKTGNWSDFYLPYIMSTFIDAGLTEEDKQKIIADVTTNVGEQVSEANKNVEAIKTRVDAIDYTKTDFINDPDNALMKAVTQYRDENQKSYADLVIDGHQSEIKALAGAEFTDNGKKYITGAGLDIDAIDGTVKEFATYKETTNSTLNNVQSKLSSVDATVTDQATHINNLDNNISSAQTQLDGLNATVTTDVAKSQYWWVKYKETDIDGENSVKEISEKENYDISGCLTDGKIDDKKVASYEANMISAGWTKELLTDALSRISQEAGKITIAANDGNSWASIVAKANKTTGTDLCLNADRVNITGAVLAEKISSNEITVKDLNVTNAKISNSTITSCDIQSQIKSSNYSAEEKTGFLLDAKGTNEGGQGAFALYADGAEITNDHITIPAANVTGKLIADQIDATSLEVDAANIKGTLKANQIDASDLHVNAANIDGTLKAGEVEATVTTSNYTKKSIMNADKFSVSIKSSDGSQGEVYIGIAPEYTIDGTTYTNMPVLYMSYTGTDGASVTRYLDPKIWITPDGATYVRNTRVSYYKNINGIALSSEIPVYRKLVNGVSADNLVYVVNSEGNGYVPFTGTAYTMDEMLPFTTISNISTSDGLSGQYLRPVFQNETTANNPESLQFNICRPNITKYTFTNGVSTSSVADQSYKLYASIYNPSDSEPVYMELNYSNITSDNYTTYPGSYSSSPLINVDLKPTGICFKANGSIYIGASMPTVQTLDETGNIQNIKITTNMKFNFQGTQSLTGPVPTNGWSLKESIIEGWTLSRYYDVAIYS